MHCTSFAKITIQMFKKDTKLFLADGTIIIRYDRSSGLTTALFQTTDGYEHHYFASQVASRSYMKSHWDDHSATRWAHGETSIS